LTVRALERLGDHVRTVTSRPGSGWPESVEAEAEAVPETCRSYAGAEDPEPVPARAGTESASQQPRELR